MTLRSIIVGIFACLVWGQVFPLPFRTLKVEKTGNFMSPPTIRLGSDDQITITFDDLADDRLDLQYRLVHCNPDWTPSRLLESEYLEGFNIADLDDWAFSQNTFVHYVNYRIAIPNEEINPLVSGNYKVEVFHRDSPEEVLAEARFSVSEGSLRVEASKSSTTDRGINTEWQQLELSLHPTDVVIDDPYSNLEVILSQNGMESSLRSLSMPSRIDGNAIIYSHRPELIFKAGNEFRRFETVSVQTDGMNVDSLRFLGKNYHAWLHPDYERASRQYSYDRTQQGRFLIREANSTDSDLGADYLTVHFLLSTPEVVNADVYVEGELTDWRPRDDAKMHYDYARKAYLLEMPLKQGSYNYRYTAVGRQGNRKADPSVIEGDKFETRNEYRIQVWYRPIGGRAPRLLADVIL